MSYYHHRRNILDLLYNMFCIYDQQDQHINHLYNLIYKIVYEYLRNNELGIK